MSGADAEGMFMYVHGGEDAGREAKAEAVRSTAAAFVVDQVLSSARW